MVEEKILTVNLWKLLVGRPRWKRKMSSAKILRDILEKKTKAGIKIDGKLNERLGKESGKLRIRLVKLDEKTIKAELV